MKVWQCTVCKYIHKGDEPPEKCPVCGVDASKFIEIDEADIPDKTPKRKQMQTAAEPAQKEPETVMGKIEALLCRHHAHPISVHAPNGIVPLAVLLWVLAWLSGSELFGKAALINLVFVITVLPFAIYTGVLEWKRKYNGAMTLIFKLKILAASLTGVSCAISIVWYLIDPRVLHSITSLGFLFINLIMLAAVGVAGHIGGKLVFKD